MGAKHTGYENSLSEQNLTKLTEWRRHLCLTFAKRTVINQKMKNMFPKRKEIRQQARRHTEKYIVNKARTERLKNSLIIYMQRLLNKDYKQKSCKETYWKHHPSKPTLYQWTISYTRNDSLPACVLIYLTSLCKNKLFFLSFLYVMCHLSRVTCHLSYVTCHLSCVTCHLSNVKKLYKKKIEFLKFEEK